ncbi:MAG: hypothetical protein HKN94_13490 [Acidimicrobiales bacterium]|nr:hypothetical protein [Acidimicrobiales bacterium]RZV45929.1 MAG: hypothetical protein EX269_08605 [Acidimicrobiales bacterium]
MKKRVVGVGAALLLALVGTVLLIAYVQSAEDRALEGEEVVEVLVVGDMIPQGARASDIGGNLVLERVPSKVAVDGALTDLEGIEELVAAQDLYPGEQLSRRRFIERIEVNAFARTEPAPEGLLEITLSMSPERFVGGSVVPGDLVAIVASFGEFDIGGVTLPENFDASLTKEELDELEKIYFIDNKLLSGDKVGSTTHILEHKVFVTHVQVEEQPRTAVDEDGNPTTTSLAPTGNLLVTIAVDAPAVERIVFTKEFGTIWMAAEPEDASEEGTTLVTRANVFAESNLR